MDPITGIIAGVGLATQVFGSLGAMSATNQMAGLASQEAGVSKEITQLQMQENSQRQLAAQIINRRQQTEIVRRTQLNQANSLAAGVAGGAQFGSGVAGGQSQARAEGAYNLLGSEQQGEISDTMFGLQNQVSMKQMTMADLQSQMASLQGQASIFQGIGAIGGSLAGSAGPLGNILGNMFNNSADPTAGPGMPKMGYLYNQ